MSNKNLLIVLLLVLLLGGGYLLYQNAQQQYTPPPQSTRTPTTQEKIVALDEQNNSSEMGTAMLKEINGKAVVTLNLTGAPKGVTQPAHIHTGSCAKLGAVKYPLTFPVDGKSETKLEVTMDQLLAQLPLAVNVHKSTKEASVYVACGDIK